MFAPKVAKPQQIRETSGQVNHGARRSSTLIARRPNDITAQQSLPGLRTQITDSEGTMARNSSSALSWDLSTVAVSEPGRAIRPQRLRGSSAPVMPGAMQPKVALGKANDLLEYEADQVAERVMNMPHPDPRVTSAPSQLNQIGRASGRERV